MTAPESFAPTTGGNSFTLRAHAEFGAKPGNLFFSGTSLRAALGLAYQGARGNTAVQMSRALDLDPDATRAAASARREAAELQSAAGAAEMFVANRLWPDTSILVKPTFTASAERGYGATTGSVDFVHAADASRITINEWVATETRGKIRDLLPEGSVDHLTRLVLTNAIYFKGAWEHVFPKAQTRDGAFMIDRDRTVTAQLMNLTSDFAFGHVADVKIVELRYDRSRLAMLVVLPDQLGGLAQVEQGLSAERLGKWVAALSRTRVNVTLPRFTFGWGGSVGAELQQLGVAEAFEESADFTGIAEPREGLYLDDVFHEAFVAVDEVGTEAAAATAAVMMARSVPPRSTEFRADHPFLFFVRDTASGQIHFAGRVVNPVG
jgi:serpin B